MSRNPSERPTRTREHWLADLSVNYVERFFLSQGHSVERKQNDYGYDIEVETFDYKSDTARKYGEVENGIIYLQLKATESLKVLADGETIAFSMSRRHLTFWQDELMPVILVVYSVVEERAYWLYVQRYLLTANINMDTAQQEITLRLSKRNVVDEAAIAKLRDIKNNVLQRSRERGNLHA